jgi:chromosome segregation ATPase
MPVIETLSFGLEFDASGASHSATGFVRSLLGMNEEVKKTQDRVRQLKREQDVLAESGAKLARQLMDEAQVLGKLTTGTAEYLEQERKLDALQRQATETANRYQHATLELEKAQDGLSKATGSAAGPVSSRSTRNERVAPIVRRNSSSSPRGWTRRVSRSATAFLVTSIR